MIRVALALIAFTSLDALGACAASPDHLPIARIAAEPAAILFHDDFQTTVMLDGTASASIDDPGEPLDFTWHLLDDDAHTDGNLGDPQVTATFRGDRPPRIILDVTTSGGLTGQVTHELQLTVP